MYNGMNLLNVAAAPKDPVKCALKLLPLLFSIDEMAKGTLEVSKKSDRVLLDAARINKMYGKYDYRNYYLL